MKIVYSDFWEDCNFEEFPLMKIVNEVSHFQVTEDLGSANFLLYSCFGENHWNAPNDVIKIFYTGENLTPDFNACDYAIGFDWLELGDRYLRFPLYYLYNDICEQMEEKHIVPTKYIKSNKSDFCSVTISNVDRNPIFMDLFDALSSYKRVDSGGSWHNNIGNLVDDKFSFDAKHKFSLVCENSSTPGYTTEKIVQAFAANCIPIYWGDPEIGKVFNKKAFINVMDFKTIEDLIGRVKEIDNSEGLYEEMLKTPALIDASYTKQNQVAILKKFLFNIFDTPFEQAKRRNRDFWGRRYISTRRGQCTVKEQMSFGLRFKILCYNFLHKNAW